MLNRSRLSWKDPSHLPIKTTHDHFTSGVWKQKSIEGLLEKSRAGRGKTERRPTTTRGKVELRSENWEWTARGIPTSERGRYLFSAQHSAVRTRSLEHAGECYENNMRREETSQQVENPKNLSSAVSTRDSTATLCSARSLSLIVVHRQLLGGCCGLEIYGKSRCWVE